MAFDCIKSWDAEVRDEVGELEIVIMRAVFLDRDGVINELIFNNETGEFEPPHDPDDLILIPSVIDSLNALIKVGFEIFIVSNQPDYAKGKTTLERLKKVHSRLDEVFKSKGINIREYYYCFHHPQGIIPGYSFQCECRKPNTLFIKQAVSRYGVDHLSSWMIGDRDSDIVCGKNSGLKTIAIEYRHSASFRGEVIPDYAVKDIKEAMNIILKLSE